MRFRLQEDFLKNYKDKQPKWGFGDLGYIVYKRSYARELEGGSEEYWQTLRRVVEGTFEIQKRHIEYLNTRWDYYRGQKSAKEMFKLMWEFKFLPPGRGLWAMGSPIVMDRNNGAPLMNCGFTSTKDIDADFPDPFCFAFEASAHGVGMGFDTSGAGKVTIVEPRVGGDTFYVEDSREGWSNALRRTLKAYQGKVPLPGTFDYSKVRPFGAPIKSFGGTASGPEALKRLLEEDIPEILTPGKISSSQIVDLMNAIGKCVVAGGARRSAMIALGQPDDTDFMNLKLDSEKLTKWRWASNNSIRLDAPMKSFDQFVDPIAMNGEPGFFFAWNAREFSRMGESDFKDLRSEGLNPCGEQVLQSGELCNIAEIFPAHCADIAEFKRAIKYGYLYTKTVTLTKTPWPKTNEVMLRNRRIGLSLSGIVQLFSKIGMSESIRWMKEGYSYVQELDKAYSDWLCIPRSIKMTTVKPSGSVSIISNSTPGIHYPESEFYIRRVEFTKGSKILEALKRVGYKCEQSIYKPESEVAEFPVKVDNFSKSKYDVSMWEQLDNAAILQQYWSDNSVSITVSLHEHEKKELATAIERYQHRLKAVSFLPISEHGYKQAPYEKITKDQYEEMKSKLKPINLNFGTHEVTDKFCDSDVCQL